MLPRIKHMFTIKAASNSSSLIVTSWKQTAKHVFFCSFPCRPVIYVWAVDVCGSILLLAPTPCLCCSGPVQIEKLKWSPSSQPTSAPSFSRLHAPAGPFPSIEVAVGPVATPQATAALLAPATPARSPSAAKPARTPPAATPARPTPAACT